MWYQIKPAIVKQTQRGFTLVEVMITIAIVAIISAIALPNLNKFLVKMRVDGEVSEMHRLLLTARNTAINTGKNTTICPITNANVCTNSANWLGIIAVINADGVIKEKAAVNTGDRLQFGLNTIVFTPTGQTLGNSTGTFSFCPRDYTDLSRGIDVSISGRVYSSSDTNGDGKDENRSGTNITCT